MMHLALIVGAVLLAIRQSASMSGLGRPVDMLKDRNRCAGARQSRKLFSLVERQLPRFGDQRMAKLNQKPE